MTWYLVWSIIIQLHNDLEKKEWVVSFWSTFLLCAHQPIFCNSINWLIFFDFDFLDSILSRAVILRIVWWGSDQHHVKYIAWPSPHSSKHYRACLSHFIFNGGRLSAAVFLKKWKPKVGSCVFFFWGGGIKLFSSGSNEEGLGGGGVYPVHRSMSADHEHRSGDYVERSLSRDSSTALSIFSEICWAREISSKYSGYEEITKTVWKVLGNTKCNVN